MRAWLYQDYAKPVFPIGRTALPVYVPPLEPPLPPVRAALPTALTLPMEAFLRVPPVVVVTPEWAPPLSLPQPPVRLLDPRTGAERPLEIPEFQQLDWFQPLSPPGPLIPLRTVDTGAGWVRHQPTVSFAVFQEVVQPVPLPPRAGPGTGAEWVHAPQAPVPSFAWFRTLDTPGASPVRPLPGSGGETPPFVAPQPVVSLAWLSPLSAPLLARGSQLTLGTGGEWVPPTPVTPPTTTTQPELMTLGSELAFTVTVNPALGGRGSW